MLSLSLEKKILLLFNALDLLMKWIWKKIEISNTCLLRKIFYESAGQRNILSAVPLA